MRTVETVSLHLDPAAVAAAKHATAAPPGPRPAVDADPWQAADTACEQLDAPLAVLDLQNLSRNAGALLRRASGTPIRVASKSVRSRAVLRAVLAQDGFSGILAYTLPEALWLAEEFDDVLLGYPSTDAAAVRSLAADDQLRSRVTLMIDSVEHLTWLESVLDATPHRTSEIPVRLAMELDVSWQPRVGQQTLAHIGVRRSPVRTPKDAVQLARNIAGRTRNGKPRFVLVGMMAYEAQIAGLADRPLNMARGAAISAIQRRSKADVTARRQAVVAALREVTPLEFINGGGTGSLEFTHSDSSVTELAAGSGLFGPTVFDFYSHFRPAPAIGFALPVVRRPAADTVTVLGGGWIASGPPGADRSPTPVYPAGLSLIPTEGAGEVQTPLVGDAAKTLSIGSKVWFRHAKSGEVCEHVNDLVVLSGAEILGSVPTYRGEGKAFI